MKLIPVLLFSCFSLGSCSSNPQISGYNKVHRGMSKAAVQNAAGSPDAKYRRKSTDRWIYLFDKETPRPKTKEVHFRGGQVVYKGSPRRAKISAGQRDRLNYTTEKQRQETEAEEFNKTNDRIRSDLATKGWSPGLDAESIKINEANFKKENELVQVGEIIVVPPTGDKTDAATETTAAPPATSNPNAGKASKQGK